MTAEILSFETGRPAEVTDGEAALVDLSDGLTAGVNEISIEATYYDLPTMVERTQSLYLRALG